MTVMAYEFILKHHETIPCINTQDTYPEMNACIVSEFIKKRGPVISGPEEVGLTGEEVLHFASSPIYFAPSDFVWSEELAPIQVNHMVRRIGTPRLRLPSEVGEITPHNASVGETGNEDHGHPYACEQLM